ncbi:hypothetical protein OSTOST_07722 [Ostertagia ostertagi]
MDFSFGDNSLAVPMREFGFQSGNDPPRLSPVSSSYQSMAPLQNMAYEMSSASVMQEESYNSFEQPSVVVNGHYQTMEQQVIQPQQGYFQEFTTPFPFLYYIFQRPEQMDDQFASIQLYHYPFCDADLTVQAVSDAPPQQVMSTSHQQQAPSGGSSNASGSLVQQILSTPSTRQTPTPQHNRQRPIQPKTQNNGRKRGSGNVGETVLSQVKQVAAAAAPTPQPRSTPRSRGSHASRQTHFETGHESPQYQPQMYLASHNQFPSTSTAQFQEYSTGNANQTQIVHQQEQVCGRQQNQQRTYRAQTATTTVYHPPPQLPPGTVYVQNVPQAAQAQFTSSQPTVGEVVRQQHQLRMLWSQNSPQVDSSHWIGQSVTGAQIRSQIVQQSPLPAQIVLCATGSSQLLRLRNYFDSLHTTLANPDTETPFADLRDVLQRLLPYHAYGEPNLSDEHLEQFDTNYMRNNINLYEQRKHLEKRLRKVFYDEALNGTEAEERNLLLYLDGEYAKRKLEEEKEFVKQGNIEAFVRDSAIIAALRDTDYESAEKPKLANPPSKPSSSKSIMQQYEYHTFDEIPRVVSPYKSPSPFKSPASSIRSPSPCKSPSSVVYSPRIRARNCSQSIHVSPAPVQEHARARGQPKPRTSSESTSEKSEARSTPLPPPLSSVESGQQRFFQELTHGAISRYFCSWNACICDIRSHITSEKSEARSTPLPPPLSSVVTRRSTPLRKAVSKDSSKSSPMAPSPVTSAPGTPASVTSAPTSRAPVPTTTVTPAAVSTPVEVASEKAVSAAPVAKKAVPEAPVAKKAVPEAPVAKKAFPEPPPVLPIPEKPAPVAPSPVVTAPAPVVTAPAPVVTAPAPVVTSSFSCCDRSFTKKGVLDAHAPVSTPGRLPAKKELLCRARQGVPAEMRSPPAHTSITTSLLYNRNSLEDEDSDGSASPELGIDDVIPLPTSMQPRSPVPQPSVPPQSRPVPIPPPPPRLPPQKPAVPLPPPLPRREKLVVPPARTSSPLVKQENVRPSAKPSVEEKPAERFRFKPQVPRPTPVSPLKPTVSKREPTVEPGLIGKDVNCINHHTGDKVQPPNCVRAPPIKLKLKLSGKEVYIENNENSVKDGDKKHRKHKKKKKERHKEHIGGVRHHKEKLRSKGHKKLQNRKEKHATSPQELVAVTSNGVRMKLKFGVATNSSGSATPSQAALSSGESSEVQMKEKVLESQPSTSKASAPTTEAVRIPRLKIRIGPESPALVIAPPVKSPASPLAVQPSNSSSTDKAVGKSKLPPVITTAQIPIASSEPLAVEFSDDSDTEAERLRCATDKALRGMSNLPGMTRPNASVLPWSTQQAP